MEQATSWLEAGKITHEDKVLYELGTKHKYSIVKAYFASSSPTYESKKALLAKTVGDDKSDIAENLRHTCEASLPDPEKKAETWASVTDPNSNDSLHVRRAKMQGFYHWSQFDLCAPYFNKFYQDLQTVHEK